MTKLNTKPTLEIATSLQNAFDFFNTRLFDGELPQANITLNRKNGAYGYFSRDRFVERKNVLAPIVTGNTVDEIALNPDTFGRSDKEILSTLVHEMVHMWQHVTNQEPKTRGYHDGLWVTKMHQVGLQPVSSSTGLRGTGTKVSHNVIEGMKFDKTCDEFLADNYFDVKYASKFASKPERKKHQKYSYRYECPNCDNWAKAPKHTNIVCGDCIEPMVNVDIRKDDN